jgi:uncharacterized protein YgiM (DUF1202 family)
MKKKILFLLFLIILFFAVIAVRYYILDRQGAAGRVKIISSPPAGVFVDNVAVGKTPFEDKLEESEYMIKLIPEGVATNTATWQGKVSVYKNSLTYINRELGSTDLTSAGEVLSSSQSESYSKSGKYGEIYVESEPVGAIVYLDGDEKGVSPLLISDVVADVHELSVYMPGFFRRTQKINVDSGFRVNANYKLAVDENQKKLDDIEGEIRKKDEEERKNSTSEAKKKEDLADEEKEAVDTASEETDEELESSNLEEEQVDEEGLDKENDDLDSGEELTEEDAVETTEGNVIIIGSTPTGWLRVRSQPNLNGVEVGKVNPGEEYEIVGEENGWFQIDLDGDKGWVSGDYVSEK